MSKEKYLNLVDILADEDKFDDYVWNFVWPGDDLSAANVEYARIYIVKKLKELIEDHFDNPPLEFKDLKEGMWLWDNKHKEYVKTVLVEDVETLWYSMNTAVGIDGVCFDKFEKNRFYRREVK